ncbi:MAG TPA: hypothetical protein VG675_13430 [Bryobacteraceae bacterium]|nr:hypothetical protein [Bryobacteraceae bacterium]
MREHPEARANAGAAGCDNTGHMQVRAFLLRPVVLLAGGLCAVALVVSLLGRVAVGPQVEQKAVELTGEPGTEMYPAFSPDGKQIAYSERGTDHGAVFHIVVRTLPDGEPRQLTEGAANDIAPVWSSDGKQLAFLRIKDDTADYYVMRESGGGLRKVAAFGMVPDLAQVSPSVAWTHDGKSLILVQAAEQQPTAILMQPLDRGKASRITAPPDGSQGDSTPLISPDGSTLAFVRDSGSGKADVFVCDLSGHGLRRLTFDDHPVRGLAWVSDGKELVYASKRMGPRWRLWRVPASGGSPREVPVASSHVEYPAAPPQGHALVYTDSPTVSAIWRASLGEADLANVEEQVVVRSTGREFAPSLSPDGEKIADVSDQTGNDEIWTSDSSGANRVQLTNCKGPRLSRPRWSPDGKSVLFEMAGLEKMELYVVAANGGPIKRLGIVGGSASWSRDGKSIYFQAGGQIWKAPAEGGAPLQLTRHDGSTPEESTDGEYVYFRRRRSIWRVPSGGGEGDDVVDPENALIWTNLQPVKNGLYYAEWERAAGAITVSFYDFAAHRSQAVFRMSDGDFDRGASFAVSPDGSYILYPKVDRAETNLMLVENFR